MNEVNRVRLIKGTTGAWEIRYLSGPERDQVRVLFDTDVLPTPYSVRMDSAQVRANLRQINPTWEIEFGYEDAWGERFETAGVIRGGEQVWGAVIKDGAK